MLKKNVLNTEMKSVGELELSEDVFGAEVSVGLMHEAVKAYMANQRSGTASTKTRGEVKASRAKPYRQKGTGRARHGSWVSPLFVGGGIAFGPKPRDYSLKITKKKKRAALRSALSSKVAEDKMIIVDKWVDVKKTKEMAKIFKNMNVESALIVLESPQDNIERTMRNIPRINVAYAEFINAYNVLAHDFLICTKDVVAKIQEGL